MKLKKTSEEMESLKEVINEMFNIDIMKNSRKRELVNGRYIYSKILRGRGHSFKSIGKSIKRDHSTVMYYIDKINFLLKQDEQLAEKYIICKDVFLKDKPKVSDMLDDKDLVLKMTQLIAENEELILDRERILSMNRKYNRIHKIIDLIDERTPKGAESIVHNKIIKMFNGLFYQQE